MQAAALNSFATHILSDRHSIILTAVALSASTLHTHTQTHTNCLFWIKDVDVGNTVDIKWNSAQVNMLFCKYVSVCVNVHVWV